MTRKGGFRRPFFDQQEGVDWGEKDLARDEFKKKRVEPKTFVTTGEGGLLPRTKRSKTLFSPSRRIWKKEVGSPISKEFAEHTRKGTHRADSTLKTKLIRKERRESIHRIVFGPPR